MCFSVPYKVLKVGKNIALLEGDKTIKIGKELSVKPGEYLRIAGDVAISTLSKSEGLKVRKLIKSLNT